MELQSLDQQLKLAIQNHQILVGKMKADPQNGVLQKQLHDLQSHIRTLSERQKQVVQQLRKDLEIKQAHVVSSNAVSSTSLSNHTQNLIKSLPQTAPLSLTTNKRTDAGRALAAKVISATLPGKTPLIVTSAVQPSQQPSQQQQSSPQAAASTNGSEPGRTPLAPVLGSTVSVNANNNNHHHNHHHHHFTPHIHQVSLAPTAVFHFTAATSDQSTTTTSNTTAGNIATCRLTDRQQQQQTPIRVPQYHAPRPASASSSSSSKSAPVTSNNVTTNANNVHCWQQRQLSSPPVANNTPVVVDEPSLTRPSPVVTPVERAPSSSVKSLPPSYSPPSPEADLGSSAVVESPPPPPPVEVVKPLPIDPAKTNFMAALGLITHDMVSELRNRRTERKRRTTANPQFSYGNWDNSEKKIMTNKYLSNSLPPGFKRPRGRPRLGSTTPTESRPSTPEEYEQNGTLANGVSGAPSRHNGVPMQKENEDTCIVCRRPGDLLSCEACFESYHVRCVEEPGSDDTKIRLKLESPWICPRCLNTKDKSRSPWPKSLALVHNFILHKSAREEEKRRLQQRCSELEAEHSDLELSAKQLNESLSVQRSKRTELMAKTKATLESIDELKKVIRVLQAS